MKYQNLINAYFIFIILTCQNFSFGQCELKVNYDVAGNRVYRGNSCDPDCSLLVINTNDDGIGSLRKAIACATDGDTILFSPALTGQFIVLTSGTIPVNKGIKILQTLSTKIKVRSDNLGPVMEMVTGTSYFRHTELFGSNEVGKDGRTLINRAHLSLENVNLYDSQNLVGNGSTVKNLGDMVILGTTKVIVLPSF